MTGPEAADKVAILLAVYNGSTDLPQQLDSFARQSHENWVLMASDDGSDDHSVAVLDAFARDQKKHGRQVDVLNGPGSGSTANFLSLISKVPAGVDWVALSDQDDVWLPERLTRGIATLAEHPEERPALYCSQTWIVDQKLGNRRLSPVYLKPVSFRNALVQNIVPGNTIMLNRAAIELARSAACEAAPVRDLPAHDWWLYQLITGVDGIVIRDPEPTLLYRQHGGNQIGANDSWSARASRISMVVSGRYRVWNSANVAALSLSKDRLTSQRRAELEQFADLRGRFFITRIAAFRRLRPYRQTFWGQIAMWIAVMANRL